MLFGVSAGLSPGPLFALVISQTVRHGLSAGITTALAPLATDLPIIVISVAFLSQYSHSAKALAVISFMGGIFVAYLGYENFFVHEVDALGSRGRSSSLKKAIFVNALSPHPYLFWMTLGGPIMLRAWQESAAQALAFVSSFYLLLVGVKVALALVVIRSRMVMIGVVHRYLMRGLGIGLWILAAFLISDGLKEFFDFI